MLLTKFRDRETIHNLLLASFWLLFGLSFYALEWLVPQREYHVMYHPVDDRIPFYELFLIPYLFWFVFMLGSYLYTFFAEPMAFRRMMWFTILTYGGGLVMFLLYPTCQNLRPVVFERDNLLTICISTVFVKQHSIIDTVCGFIFSGYAWLLVYGTAERVRARRLQMEKIL